MKSFFLFDNRVPDPTYILGKLVCTYLPTYLPTYLLTYQLPTYLSTYLPTYYLPTYLLVKLNKSVDKKEGGSTLVQWTGSNFK